MRDTITKRAVHTAAPMQLQLFGEETGAAVPAATEAHAAGEQQGAQGDFEAMIRGPYKEAFAQKVQQIIDRRLKEMRGLQKQARETEPLLQALRLQLQLPGGTPDALLAALQKGDAAAAATARALTDAHDIPVAMTQDAQATGKPRAAEEPPRGAVADGAEEQALRQAFLQSAGRRYHRLAAQAEEAARYYADFDLTRECRDPAFTALVLKGLDMKTAYEVRHREALLQQAMQRAAQQAVQYTLQDIRMRGLRPMENGMQARASARSRTDVAGMTRAQRAGIARRVMRGERITLD